MAGEAAKGGLMSSKVANTANKPRSAMKIFRGVQGGKTRRQSSGVATFFRPTITHVGCPRSGPLSDTERAVARALASAVVRAIRAEADATKAA